MNIIKKIKEKVPNIARDYKQKRQFLGTAKATYCSVAIYLGRWGVNKHKYISGILKACIPETLTEFAKINGNTLEIISDDCPIWVMWWQGENAMPPIVRQCMESIRLHRGKHPVIMLDSKNYTNYIQLPPPILQKLTTRHWIAQISDIIRFGLLERYGGIWLDATILVTQDIGAFDTSLYSIRHRQGNPRFVLDGSKWSSFMFACTKGHPVSAFIHKALIEYFEKHDYLADYWLTDYVIAIMYTESPTLRKYIDDLPLDNPTCLALLLERDKPFEKNRFYEIITTNRFNKLDWRIPVLKGTMLERALNLQTNNKISP